MSGVGVHKLLSKREKHGSLLGRHNASKVRLINFALNEKAPEALQREYGRWRIIYMWKGRFLDC